MLKSRSDKKSVKQASKYMFPTPPIANAALQKSEFINKLENLGTEEKYDILSPLVDWQVPLQRRLYCFPHNLTSANEIIFPKLSSRVKEFCVTTNTVLTGNVWENSLIEPAFLAAKYEANLYNNVDIFVDKLKHCMLQLEKITQILEKENNMTDFRQLEVFHAENFFDAKGFEIFFHDEPSSESTVKAESET